MRCQMPFKWTVETFWILPETMRIRGGSRGRVQGVRPPPSPWDDLWFSNTTGILQKKQCGLLVLKYSKRRVHPLLKKSWIRPWIWRNQTSETSSIQTQRNRKQYCTVILIKWVRQVTFFNVKIEKFEGGNLSHFRCLACWVVEFNYKCPFNTGWQQ